MIEPYYTDDSVTLYHGDALEVLRSLDADSVDAVVTDPPYGLEFMGREWDAPWRYGFSRTGYTDGKRMARPNFGSTRNPVCRTCRKHQRGSKRCMCETPDFDETPADSSRLYGQWCEAWAREVFRVLKPGGHLLAFGGTRTVHRLTCAIEDAGFEIRDGIDWIYASGFPKSLDVSKAIDKAAGAEREVIGTKLGLPGYRAGAQVPSAVFSESGTLNNGDAKLAITAPATEDAKRWHGWGTALKPAREPIVVARKPLAGTVAQNVLAYGTGALNIDGCRVGLPEHKRAAGTRTYQRFDPGSPAKALQPAPHDGLGRWPSNLILSHAPDCGETCVPGCPVAELDAQSGDRKAGGNLVGTERSRPFKTCYGDMNGRREWQSYGDSGGASRFFPVFRYEPKADSAERPRVNGVAHPTVKPLALIRWLVRLVTPPGGRVLDMFAGSGTTAEACVLEGFRCITVEREADYLPLIVARLSKPLQPVLDLGEAS